MGGATPMIKAVLKDKDSGVQTLLLGLSEENVTRLRHDKPILIDGTPFGLRGWNIAIAYGPTEADIVSALVDHLGPPAVVHKDVPTDG